VSSAAIPIESRYPRSGRDGVVDCCPECGGTLEGAAGLSIHESAIAWTCERCGRKFGTVVGVPDLRLASDRYLSLDADRHKAMQLAAIAETSTFDELIDAYYAITSDVDLRRGGLYQRHIARAEARGKTIAACLPARGRILEVGCGTGGLLAAADSAERSIVGIDIALRWLVVARARLKAYEADIPLIGADAEKLPWPDASFDAVVADSIVEHLSDAACAFREWARVVRPGGRLLLWSPNRYSFATDPHVGLWGVGWLPRRLAAPYVRLRRACAWPIRLLSAENARRLAIESGWVSVRTSAPRLDQTWAKSSRERAVLRVYERIRQTRLGVRLLAQFGPLWQLDAKRGSAA
jgi:SAM-dependent methyltransferase